jgi:hypothetical protein
VNIDSFENRFDPDGECQIVALDFIFYFLNSYPADVDKFRLVKGLASIMDFLKANNFSFIVNPPILSILFPNYWILKTKYFKYIRFRKGYNSKTNELSILKINYAILIEENAKKIYGLKREYWTHFVAYYNDFKNKKSGIYDPLRVILENEYSRELNNLNLLSETEINKKSLLKILIWKNT